MGITIDSRSKTVLLDIKGMEKATRRSLRRGWYMVGRKLKSTASENIKRKGRRGRVYKVRTGQRVRRHVASVPGESWANVSGKTRRGIVYNVVSDKKLLFGNTEKVAKFLEFGTKNIKPRPAHLISIKQNNRNIVNIMGKHLEEAIGK